MAGISDKAIKTNYAENKYRFNKGSELQNKEFSDGTGLEMYETNLRELDPQLGRWWQIDSKPDYAQSPYASMGNNPILYNDPMGDTAGLGTFIMAAMSLAVQSNSSFVTKAIAGPATQSVISNTGDMMNGFLNAKTAGAWRTNPADAFGIPTQTNPWATSFGQAVGVVSVGSSGATPDVNLAPVGDGSSTISFNSNADPLVLSSTVYATGTDQGSSGNENQQSDKKNTLQPGPYAGESIPARSSARVFTPAERTSVNNAGATSGCHTCGIMTPGTKSGNWIPDHQPVSALNWDGLQQYLYPQCLNCSQTQGGQTLQVLKQK